jgi:hypothetical protein
MWSTYSTTTTSANGDTWESPVRRYISPGADFWIEEAACCLCGCLSTGPIFIIVGMLFLVRVAAGGWRGCCAARVGAWAHV